MSIIQLLTKCQNSKCRPSLSVTAASSIPARSASCCLAFLPILRVFISLSTDSPLFPFVSLCCLPCSLVLFCLSETVSHSGTDIDIDSTRFGTLQKVRHEQRTKRSTICSRVGVVGWAWIGWFGYSENTLCVYSPPPLHSTPLHSHPAAIDSQQKTLTIRHR